MTYNHKKCEYLYQLANVKPNVKQKIITYWKQISNPRQLGISLIVSGLIYLAFTLPFPLSRYYTANPPVDYAKLTQHSVWGFAAYLAGILSIFGLYLINLRALTQPTSRFSDKQIFRLILLSGAAFALILLFSYPQMAIDMLVYALHSRGWALYGLSPFIANVEAFPPGDPWAGLAGEWSDAASPYGPLWEWLSLGAYHLSGGNFLVQLYILKIIGVLAYLGSAWLIYRILRLVHPRWAMAGTAFFAWNPLVLFESVQNAHNDIVMVFFLLLAIWAYTRLLDTPKGWQYFAFSALFILGFTFSILIKFITLLILPFFLLGLALRQKNWLNRFAVMTVNGLAIMLLSGLLMRPDWPGWENWAVLQAGEGAGRSLAALLVLALREIPEISTSQAFTYTNRLIYLTFGGIYLWGLWRVICQGRKCFSATVITPNAAFEAPLRAGFYIFVWYILLVASVFHAWYLLWFISLAALLIPEKRVLSVAFIFSLMALLVIPYYETIRVWLPYLNQNHLLGHLIGVPLLIVPVLFSLWMPILILPEFTGDKWG